MAIMNFVELKGAVLVEFGPNHGAGEDANLSNHDTPVMAAFATPVSAPGTSLNRSLGAGRILLRLVMAALDCAGESVPRSCMLRPA